MKTKNRIKQLEKELNELKLLHEAEKYVEPTKEEQEKYDNQRKRTFNGMTAKEWASSSRSVWSDVSSAREKRHLLHGATFPQKLAERVITMYSGEGDLIFDPFLGTGTTIFAAQNLNRKSIGIELNEKFIKFIEKKLGIFKDCKVVFGDCLLKTKELVDNSIQLTFTSPPYADLMHKVKEDREKRHKKSAFVIENNSTSKPYSNHENDLGNMDLKMYEKSVSILMKEIYKKTKDKGYNIWVVKDFRDTKNKIPYIDLHTLIAKAGEKAGFKYHDLIIWDQNEQRSLVLLGYPSVFYVNQNHSYLVVLRK